MAIKKIQIIPLDNDYGDILYPETSADMVKFNDGTTVESHLADYLYQTAGGTATAITLTGLKLEDGHPKTFIASANNSGAATTINGKPLYKPNTTDTPNLVAGKAYTVWYSGTDDCFFIKASAEGNVTADKVLAGYTFSNDDDTGMLGTMPDPMSITASDANKIGEAPSEIIDSVIAMHKIKEIKINRYGTVRVKFDLRVNVSGKTGYGRIYVNDVAVGINRSTTSTSYTTYTEDISVQIGDLIQLYGGSDGSTQIRVRRLYLYAEELPTCITTEGY